MSVGVWIHGKSEFGVKRVRCFLKESKGLGEDGETSDMSESVGYKK